jgi:hypothetical protein
MTETDRLEVGADKSIILKLIKKTDMTVWIGFKWLIVLPVAGHLWA